MIEYGLFAAAGFLLAAALSLMVIPFLTGRAASKAVRKLKANMPFSTAEMAAEKDQMRAEHAIELRKIEIDRAKQAEKVSQQNIELREVKEKLVGIGKVSKAGKLALEEMRAKEHDLNERLRQRDAQLAGLEQRSRQMLRENRELKQAARKNGQPLPVLKDETEIKTSASGLPVADEDLASGASITSSKMRQAIDDERARSKRLEKQLEEARRKLSKMRTELENKGAERPNLPRAVLPASLGGAELKPVDLTDNDAQDIREEMANMAVTLTRVSAMLEGPRSKIYKILETIPAEDTSSLGALMKAALEHVPAKAPELELTKPAAKTTPTPPNTSKDKKPEKSNPGDIAETEVKKDKTTPVKSQSQKPALALPIADEAFVPAKKEIENNGAAPAQNKDNEPVKKSRAPRSSRSATPKRTASAKPRARKANTKSTSSRSTPKTEKA